ncbi:MAG: metal ABC transporter substrate-binding protein [Butyrivibrio sp.]|nr:metal ABC transporter substrate-binding protein [Butyrivibrio sp.]
MKKEYLKKAALGAALIISASSLYGCSSAKAESGDYTVLKGITDLTPHSEIIEYAKPYLEEKGIKVELVSTAADVTTNEKLVQGEIDFNFFQHEPYLQEQNEANGWDLVNAGDIHVEPITAYSEKYSSVDEVPEEAVVAIPNDGTNEYRALLILEENGFIKLNEETATSLSASVKDITEYVKPIEIVEIDSAQIIPTRDDYDFFITNTNKYLESGIEANLLFQESANSPYANIIAVRAEDADSEAIKTFVEVLQSEEVQNWIADNYNGAVIPVK